jgi:manganese/zinc/iron transport system substrate-binding protein
MMKKWILSVVVIVGLCLLAACGSNQATNNESGKIVVTTTTGQVADVVKNVGGDKVDVISLMGPGIDPHLYRASQGDIKKLNDAEIIFYNGVHLEGKMEDIFEKMSKGKPTVAVADSIPADQLLTVEGSNSHDPHVWFDIPAWIHVVDTVEQELTKLSPENEEQFKQNASHYKKELEEMDQYAKEQIATIPEESRVLVTAHDAFNYFGNAYGLEVMGLQGLSTDSEYGLKDVQALVDTIVKRNIKAVFVESSIIRSIRMIRCTLSLINFYQNGTFLYTRWLIQCLVRL